MSPAEIGCHMLALQFEEFGPPSVIKIVDHPHLLPGPEEVLVDMAYAGLNPVDSNRRKGLAEGVSLPSGVGREFSGVVRAVGGEVKGVVPGDLVLGSGEGIIGEEVVVHSSMLAPVPQGLDLQRASCLAVAPQTAWCALNSQPVNSGSTILVSGASGGVGSIVAQLAVQRGAKVIGTARVANHDLLRSWGVTPLDYATFIIEGVRVLAPEGVDIVFDHTGDETVLAALALGVPRERINSTSGAGITHGTPTVGRKGINQEAISKLGSLISAKKIDLRIHAVLDWFEAREAYELLDSGDTSGKVVLRFPKLADRSE